MHIFLTNSISGHTHPGTLVHTIPQHTNRETFMQNHKQNPPGRRGYIKLSAVCTQAQKSFLSTNSHEKFKQ